MRTKTKMINLTLGDRIARKERLIRAIKRDMDSISPSVSLHGELSNKLDKSRDELRELEAERDSMHAVVV